MANYFVIIGLIFDLLGAVLLIGNEWKWTNKFGLFLKPRFKTIDDGLFRLGNLNQEIGEDDPALEPIYHLMDNAIDRDTDLIGEEVPVEIVPDDDDSKKVVLRTEQQGLATNVGMSTNERIDMWLLSEIAQRRFQSYFTKWGVALLIVGFAIQIGANWLLV